MQTGQRHIIHQQTVDLQFPAGTDASAIQQKLDGLLQHEFWPGLSSILDALASAEEWITLDRLEIALPPQQWENWEKTLGPDCLQALRQTLPQRIAQIRQGKPEQGEVLSAEMALFRLFTGFLQNGTLSYLPFASCTAAELEARWLEAFPKVPASILAAWREQITRDALALQRLVQQFSAHFLQVLFELLSGLQLDPLLLSAGVAQDPNHHKFPKIADLDRHVQRQVFQALFALPQVSAAAVSATLASLPTAKTELDLAAETPEAPAHSEKSYFIENSGLVLLHPFLERFFESCELVQNGAFLSPDCQYQAVHLLQYLCTGEQDPLEYALPLNKILCGIPVAQPIPREQALPPAMKQEAETLLQAVIGHWSALKNTSPAGLQETFLQRPGKLSAQQGTADYQLLVEQRGVDALLDKLPWGYGIIKLPWMPGFVHSTWT